MRFDKLMNSWDAMIAERRWDRTLLVLLAAANLVGWLDASREDAIVVLSPPALASEARIGRGSADAGYKAAWGLFVARTLGNVTPGSAALVLPSLDPLLDPSIYHRVRQAIEKELDMLKQEALTLSFEPRSVEYDPLAERVFVRGSLATTGVRGRAQKDDRTYEIGIRVDDYRPRIVHLEAYPTYAGGDSEP